MEKDLDFEAFFKANERRIHFQIRRLRVPNHLYGEFYSEGIFALWKAYKRYNPGKGKIGTFTNYQIRYRLIDLTRKKNQEKNILDKVLQDGEIQIDDGNRYGNSGFPIVNPCGIPVGNEAFWSEVQGMLTPNQWKWVHYFIIAELTIKEIMEIENVSADAVKGWGREVRRKLKGEAVREKLERLV